MTAPDTTSAPDRRVGRAAVALLLVVASGALVLSFAGLALLGVLAGFGRLAPVLAVVVDSGTGAATLFWLTGDAGSPRGRYARRLGLALLVVSLVGNGVAHGLAAGGMSVDGLTAGLVLALPWWAAAVVGALPPAIFAGVVHLLAMGDGSLAAADPGGLPVGDAGDAWATHRVTAPDWWATVPAAAPSTPAEYAAARTRGRDPGEAGEGSGPPSDDPDVERLAALLAAGAGRRRVARELDISEHRARELLAAGRRSRVRR